MRCTCSLQGSLSRGSASRTTHWKMPNGAKHCFRPNQLSLLSHLPKKGSHPPRCLPHPRIGVLEPLAQVLSLAVIPPAAHRLPATDKQRFCKPQHGPSLFNRGLVLAAMSPSHLDRPLIAADSKMESLVAQLGSYRQLGLSLRNAVANCPGLARAYRVQHSRVQPTESYVLIVVAALAIAGAILPLPRRKTWCGPLALTGILVDRD